MIRESRYYPTLPGQFASTRSPAGLGSLPDRSGVPMAEFIRQFKQYRRRQRDQTHPLRILRPNHIAVGMLLDIPPHSP